MTLEHKQYKICSFKNGDDWKICVCYKADTCNPIIIQFYSCALFTEKEVLSIGLSYVEGICKLN